MRRITKESTPTRSDRRPASRRLNKYVMCLSLALLPMIAALTGCGTAPSNNVSPLPPQTLSGNWQFTMAAPSDGSFLGGLQGGFLLQNNGSVTGSVAYSIALPPIDTVCNSGSAAITGSIKGQSVNLTATAGGQTFTFVGTLDIYASTMTGTYSSTAGSQCGTAQSGLAWTAILVPPLTGTIQGTFYSTGGMAGLLEQNFLVSGSLTQGANTGASSATLTGSLSFLNAVSNTSDYPCIAAAQVNGQISGNTVTLQIVGSGGSNMGQIGASPGSASNLGTVTFDPVQNAYVLHSLTGTAYAVTSSGCPGAAGPPAIPGDYGDICLALETSSLCTQPITLVPASLSFPSQLVGSTSTQTTTLTNTSKSIMANLTLAVSSRSGTGTFGETDTCGSGGSPSNGAAFTLNPGQNCIITISYSPQCSASCPSKQQATLLLNSFNSNTIFTLPISGIPQPSSSAERSRTNVWQLSRVINQNARSRNAPDIPTYQDLNYAAKSN